MMMGLWLKSNKILFKSKITSLATIAVTSFRSSSLSVDSTAAPGIVRSGDAGVCCSSSSSGSSSGTGWSALVSVMKLKLR